MPLISEELKEILKGLHRRHGTGCYKKQFLLVEGNLPFNHMPSALLLQNGGFIELRYRDSVCTAIRITDAGRAYVELLQKYEELEVSYQRYIGGHPDGK